MKIALMKESKYLRKEDLQGRPWRVTIKSFKKGNVARADDEPEIKWIFVFKELDRPVVMNQTNLELIGDALNTDDSNDFAGREITLWDDPSVKFGGKRVGGIRVREVREGDESPPQKPRDMTDDDDEVPWAAE